jgi:RHS repeat-associated protein
MKSAKEIRIKSHVNHSPLQSCITLLMLCMALMLALPGHAQLLVPGQPDPINLTFLGDNSSLYVCTKGGTGTKSSDTSTPTTSKGKKSSTVSAASTNLSTVSSTSCVLPAQDSLTLTTENDLPNAITSFGNDASFINLSMPLNMVAGQSYDVAVSMKNSGNTTWQPGTWKLGSQAPQDNTLWGPNRVQLAAPVGPGGSVAFFFTIRAPTTPGVYTYKWQMVQEFVEFFGAPTTVYQINVTAPPPPAPTLKNGASLISLSVPLNMVTGQSYNVAVSMNNSGTTTWQPGIWKLGSQAPQDNTTWGPNRVQLAAPVAPGSSVAFSFVVRAPTTPGIYTYKWQMVEEYIEFFGAPTTEYQISVTAPPPPTPAPTLTVTRTPTTMVANQSFALNWSTSNATSLTRVCTATGTGFVANGTLATSGSAPGTASSAWVGFPSTCTWTATGAGGSKQVIETMTTNAAPPPPAVPTLTVTRTPTTMVANQSFTLNWSTTNATSLTRVCTSTGTGFVANGTLATSGSAPGTASSAWVGFPSTCTWTANGAGGSKQVIETMTTNAAAPPPPPPPPSGPTVTYIHTDGLGSPVARTNEQGELISRTRYEPYGATAGGATPGIGFTGHVNDPETGLTYMQQRYYDPLAGRFMSVDPVLTDNNTGASFNRYVYANNSPYNYIDPDGRAALAGVVVAPILLGLGYKIATDPQARAFAARVFNSVVGALKPGATTSAPLLNSNASENQKGEKSNDGPAGESPTIDPKDVGGKSAADIEKFAGEKGLEAKGDPKSGRGSFIDPVTGEQRILIHPDGKGGGHTHVNDASGQRLDINGKPVSPESPAAHLPLGQ